MTPFSEADWVGAPDWAQYVAQDSDGHWYWYEAEPHIIGNVWDVCLGKSRSTHKRNPRWKTTLQQRQKPQQE